MLFRSRILVMYPQIRKEERLNMQGDYREVREEMCIRDSFKVILTFNLAHKDQEPENKEQEQTMSDDEK